MKTYIILATFIVLFPGVLPAQDALPPSVKNALSYRKVPDNALSIFVEDLASGEVVLAWNDDTPRNPASVEKMVTTLIALDILGPTYRWKTEVSAVGVVSRGTLVGDLLIKGYGDPYLVTERFWQMLRRVRQLGIENIDGNLLLDDSYFDVGNYDPAAFDREPLRAYNVPPSALLTNFKVIRYYFVPEPAMSRVRVTLEPPLENLEIVNQLTTTNGACRGYQRGIAIIPNEDYSRITLSGRFPSGCEIYALDRTALSHNEFTYGVFKSLWEESGGGFSGAWKNVIAEDVLLDESHEPLLIFESLPLSEVIAKVNKYSNNVMAKQLLYTLAAEAYGPTGTESKGLQVVREWLAEHGMGSEELRIDNGAGLSRDSRMTARHLADVLRYAYESPFMPEYLASLSLSGLDGTLSGRFRNSALTGQAHMKTGSLDHVSAVAGFFQSRSGKRFIVVTMLNHTDVHRGPGKEVQEMLLRWLYER
ncbi:MAG: D-alanyl-D-alanine carboxypeptidase/D-alanyl-D-alanine-endopeptidase [Pseudomonadota bacterium]|nr:D-alanyl-D-alanine carboxypeptidase/D-alanyl-D-alanine-endopeptidase [Pseudomonadota bacterium]